MWHGHPVIKGHLKYCGSRYEHRFCPTGAPSQRSCWSWASRDTPCARIWGLGQGARKAQGAGGTDWACLGHGSQHLRLRPGSSPEAGPVLEGQFWEPAAWP